MRAGTQNPLVTVVMAAYNVEGVIEHAIRSIVEQSYRNWELLVIDDGSTDGTRAVVERCGDHRVRCFSQPNRGRSAARNAALREARGHYVAPMDADDISPPGRLESEVAFLESHRDIGVVSGRVLSFSKGRGLRPVRCYPQTMPEIHARFARGVMGVCHGGSMLRRQVIDRVGMYCDDCLVAEDFDLFLRASDHFGFCALPEVVLYYRNDPQQLTYPRWTRLHLYHEYAIYRRNCFRTGRRPGDFSTFVRTVRPWCRVLTWHTLRYAKACLLLGKEAAPVVSHAADMMEPVPAGEACSAVLEETRG